jgi:hypothetical protein
MAFSISARRRAGYTVQLLFPRPTVVLPSWQSSVNTAHTYHIGHHLSANRARGLRALCDKLMFFACNVDTKSID